MKKVDYDYVHDARCSIQSYNRCVRAMGGGACDADGSVLLCFPALFSA